MLYSGSCHCGNIRFEVEGELGRATACNCSICSRKGSLLWFVPRARLKLLVPDENVADYTFGPATVHHRFCPTCGIHPYGEGSMPDGTPIAAINVRCLEGVEIESLPIDHFDGRAL
jgi:hypothetical protein